MTHIKLALYLTICCRNPQGDHLKRGPTSYVAKVMQKSVLSQRILGLDNIWVLQRSRRLIIKQNP